MLPQIKHDVTKIHAIIYYFSLEFCKQKVLAPFPTTICKPLYTTFVHNTSMQIRIIEHQNVIFMTRTSYN